MNKILSIIFFSFVSLLAAQNECDCEEAQKQRGTFGRNFESGNFDSAFIYVDKVKDGKQNICDAFYYNWMSQIYTEKHEYVKAREYLNKEFEILKKLNCPARLARHYSNYCNYFNFTNKPDSSIYVLLKALEILEKTNDKEEQIRVNINIGSIFAELKQFDKSVSYHKRGVDLSRQLNDTNYLATSLTYLSSTYLGLGEITKQKKYFDSSMTAAKEGLRFAWKKMNIYYILEGYQVIGRLNYFAKEYLNGIAYADSIINISPREPGFFNRYFQLAYSIKGNCLMELNKNEMARQMADSSLHFAKLFNIQLAIEPLELIYKTSKRLNDNERALWAHEQMKILNDSLFTLKKNETISELEGKYSQEKNERRIDALNQQKKTYLFISLIILLVAAVVVFIFRQQSLKQKQSLIETEQRLNRSRINPHFFFNVISSLQYLAAREVDKKKLVNYFFSFSKLMRQTLESSYDEYVNINEEIEFISHYLKLQELKRAGLFAYEIEVNEKLSKESTLIPAMILQPFLENSVEHGFSNMETGGKIEIKFDNQDSEIVITITDNGKGLKTEDKKDGHISRATQITTDRLFLINKQKKSNARFTIVNNLEKQGTVVKIFLPLL